MIAMLLALLGLFLPLQGHIALAASNDELDVISELSKDPTFHQNEYPNDPNDYSLKVIQIGESDRDELYVYVYQPAHEAIDLIGTKISISYGYSVNGSGLSPQLYDLKLVSTYSVFDKYLVKGFSVPNDGERFYNIVEIFRAWNINLDVEQGSDDFEFTYKAYSVGQQWYVHDINDSKSYEMNTFETLPVDTIFEGSFYLPDGMKWLDQNTYASDVWFYCFSTDAYVIKHVYDADLNYSMVPVHHIFPGSVVESGYFPNEAERQENLIVRLKDTDIMSHTGDGIFARTFEWKKILTSSDFVKHVEDQHVIISDEVKQTILSSQFVFTYLLTDRTTVFNPTFPPAYEDYYDVYDVGLLRLHFQDTSGKVYDLGVVNDLSDPDNIPDGYGTLSISDFWNLFIKVVMIIVLVILILVLLKFVEPVMKVLKLLFKGLVFIITAPFKMIKALFDKPNKSDKP